MKRTTLTILFLLTIPAIAFATRQQPDIIFYDNVECQLHTSWAYPSPFEVFFIKTGQRYPFQELHTANYRGYIATWKIEQETLLLIKLEIEEKEKDLTAFFSEKSGSTPVKAFWFTGMILIKKGIHKKFAADGKSYSIAYKEYIFVQVEAGLVKKTSSLSEDQYQQANNCYWQKKNCGNNPPYKTVEGYYKYTQSLVEKNE